MFLNQLVTRLLLILFLSFFSLRVHSQSTKIYDYENPELRIKPSPSKEFIIWLKNNNQKLGIKAPFSSKKETKVTLVFEVDENGQIQNPKIWRGVGQGYDEYAYHLIKNNPNAWKPGKNEAGPVKTEVYYQLDYMKNKNTLTTRENKPVK